MWATTLLMQLSKQTIEQKTEKKTSVLLPMANVSLEAEILLSFVLNRDRIYLYTWPDKILAAEEIALFKACIERRKIGEPIAYIIEHKEFWSLPFKVTPSVLIPRPETEILVEQLLQILPRHDPTIRILELGTGSGAIAIALAKECPLWQLVATDISQAALDIAKLNAKNLAINSIQWLLGDWYAALSLLPPEQSTFHAIVSNPPYIAEQDPHLFSGDLRYEPNIALEAKNSGYFALEQIINEAPKHLLEGGWIFLEHGLTQATLVKALLKKAHFFNITVVKDLAGVNRVTVAKWLKNRII